MLDVRAEGGQRGPQLVAGVGHESLLLLAGGGQRGHHACSGSGRGSPPRLARLSGAGWSGRSSPRCPRRRRGGAAPAGRCARPAPSRAPPRRPRRPAYSTKRSRRRLSVDSSSERSRAICSAPACCQGTVSWRYLMPSSETVRSTGSACGSCATSRSRSSTGSGGPPWMQATDRPSGVRSCAAGRGLAARRRTDSGMNWPIGGPRSSPPRRPSWSSVLARATKVSSTPARSCRAVVT